MTPEHWQNVEEIFEAGLNLPEGEREQLLCQKCPESPAVAEQVRSLWKHVNDPTSFLDRPVAELPGTEDLTRQVLERGTVISGRFTVLELIGAGGMGEVYRVRDERLGRTVAVKVVSRALSSRPEYRLRLEREARAASALGHPRICSLYDVGSDGELTYLVMELLKGELLSSRIARGPLPLADLLEISFQITDALACAHAAGIVHRDLKPANIMLTDAGVKLLDFGVAKRSPGLSAGSDSQPTITATIDGQIVGTIAYMSPEQAEGKAVDARSDLFSFGSILYEMATGRRPFIGDSTLSTLAAILRETPPSISALLPASPPELDRLIRRCLEKDPDRRPASAGELQQAISSMRTSQPRQARVKTWSRGLVAATVVLALGAAVWTLLANRRDQHSYTTPARVTVESGNALFPALSKDGKLLAYASDRNGKFDLYVRQVGGASEVRLTSAPYNETAPSFTPDGKYIVFASDEPSAGLQVIPALGGPRRILNKEGYRPAVSPDGKSVVFWTSRYGNELTGPGSAVWAVPFEGGQSRNLQPNFLIAAFPVWLDSGHILFTGAQQQAPYHWWVTDLNGQVVQSIDPESAGKTPGDVRGLPRPLFAINGAVYAHMQIGDAHELIAFAINPARPAAAGTVSRVLYQLDRISGATLSEDGQVAVSVSTVNDDLYLLRFDKKTGRVSEEPQRLTSEPSMDNSGSVTRDGRMLTWLSNRSGKRAVWIRNLADGTDRMLAEVHQRPAARAELSPDGHYLVFTAPGSGTALTMMRTSGEIVQSLPLEGLSVAGFTAGWRTNNVLRVFRRSADQQSRRYLDLSVPDGRILKESDLMTRDTPLDCHALTKLEWCSSLDKKMFVRSFGSRQVPTNAVGEVGGQLMMVAEDESAYFWQREENNHDVLWGRLVDTRTGSPKGEPFVSHHFRGPARVANIHFQNQAIRDGMAVITMGTQTSNIWLQQLPR